MNPLLVSRTFKLAGSARGHVVDLLKLVSSAGTQDDGASAKLVVAIYGCSFVSTVDDKTTRQDWQKHCYLRVLLLRDRASVGWHAVGASKGRFAHGLMTVRLHIGVQAAG